MDKIDGIRAFVAVVDAGSFTRAGERLGISNKLVSKYVAALEGLQGVTLLHRTTRSLSLTLSGERYLSAARRVLAALEDLDSQAHADEGALKGRLRISVPVTFGEMFIRDLTLPFLEQHPAIALDIRLADRFVDLAAEGFDAAIRIGSLPDSSLKARKLGQIDIWSVASPAYLAKNPAPSIPDDLRHHRFIRDTNSIQPARATYFSAGQPVSVPLASRIEVNSAAASRALALAGEGIAISPDFVVAEDVVRGDLVRLLADHPLAALDIQAVHLPQSFLPARLNAYLDFLRDQFRKQLALRAQGCGRSDQNGASAEQRPDS